MVIFQFVFIKLERMAGTKIKVLFYIIFTIYKCVFGFKKQKKFQKKIVKKNSSSSLDLNLIIFATSTLLQPQTIVFLLILFPFFSRVVNTFHIFKIT